jgi:hypothetical protein
VVSGGEIGGTTGVSGTTVGGAAVVVGRRGRWRHGRLAAVGEDRLIAAAVQVPLARRDDVEASLVAVGVVTLAVLHRRAAVLITSTLEPPEPVRGLHGHTRASGGIG